MSYERFIDLSKDAKKVVEFGTRRWGPNPTHRQALFPNASLYLLSDALEGTDVDLVHDLEDPPPEEFFESFDAVLCCSVFEHIQHPWIAASNLYDWLKPGGLCFVQTHQSFPVHGYPLDYFRFSGQGLEACFDGRSWSHIESKMSQPAKIVPDAEVVGPWDFGSRGYLISEVLLRK